jgi:hypothetical protein
LVDDHSRFVIGLRILTETKATPILAWLEDCFELCGRPLELMSDNGLPFRRTVMITRSTQAGTLGRKLCGRRELATRTVSP